MKINVVEKIFHFDESELFGEHKIAKKEGKFLIIDGHLVGEIILTHGGVYRVEHLDPFIFYSFDLDELISKEKQRLQNEIDRIEEIKRNLSN